MTISSVDNSRGPTGGEEQASDDGNATTVLLSVEENEPLLQMLFRQQEESMRLQEESMRMQEESMRLQEERYLREISGLRQEINERLLGSEQQSREDGSNFLDSSDQSSFNFQSKSSGITDDPEGEAFYDDLGAGVNAEQFITAGTAGKDISKGEKTAVKPEIKLWMYDLGGNERNVSAKRHRKRNHDNRKASIFNSRVNRNIKEGGLTVSFGGNDDEEQKALYQEMTTQQQNRRNFVAIVKEEFIALEDHRKQQDERIQSQDNMIQQLEAKMQQIETQGIQAATTSTMPGRYSIFHTFTELSSPSEDSDCLNRDTFTMMILNKTSSRSWILGTTSFCFEMILGTMIAINQFKASVGTSIFDVPFKVDTEVRIVQFLSIILCLSIQSDVLTSIKSFVLLGRGSNWRQVIGVGEHNSAIASCGLWTLRIGVPNTMKLVQGLTVTFVSFVIIVQANTIIDLLKDFTALMIVSETDNILYQLAIYGYLGEQLRQEARQIEQKKEPTSVLNADERYRGKNNGLVYVRIVFLLLLGGMFGGWGIIFHNQRNGLYFREKFPGCVSYELALEHFGDGECYGGTLNTIECKFENGDCINYNTAFPNCKGKGLEGLVNVEDELGKGECNMDFAIPECDYDGGLCCPFDIHRSPTFRDGQCHGGIISSIGCDRDGGDCLDFMKAYPNCDIESGANGTALGDGICEGGGYTTEECGYENGDCDVGQIGEDISFTAIFSRVDGGIYFNMKMSSDGSTVLIEVLHTGQSGEFNRNAPGRVLGYRYDPEGKRWVEQPILEGHKTFYEPQDDLSPSSWAVNGDGNLVAFGFQWYNNDLGQVDVFDFVGIIGSTPRNILLGSERFRSFGSQLDITDDGSRMAVSSYDSGLGMVQVFQYDNSEQVWIQVGNNVIGNTSDEAIGSFFLRINSLDGTRLFFDVFNPSNTVDDPPFIRAYELNTMNSNQWIQLGGDISLNVDGRAPLKEIISSKIVVSADGSRIAQSSYSMMSTRPGQINIFDFISDPNVSIERKWSQLGPTIYGMYSNGEYKRRDGDGFGRDIGMSADGLFLAISSVKPSCGGLNRDAVTIGYYYVGTDEDVSSTSSDLCATGSVKMYQYKSKNPPHRPFALLPYKRSTSFQTIMEEVEQERDGTVLGLHLSLSGDGSKIAVSGLDLTSKNGFVKVYNVADLFYVDCIVDDPEEIGNGDCNEYAPYYTEECGYDGGDCPLPSPVDGFDACKVEKPTRLGDGHCKDFLPYNSEECGYDGGDCPLPAPVDGYPNCFVSYPEYIGSGHCSNVLPHNSYDCGFDGGDCLPEEYAPTSSPSESNQPSQSPSISSSPTKSIQPSHIPSPSPSFSPTETSQPSYGPSSESSSEPSLTHGPSQSSSPSDHPSTSVMPTTTSIVMYLELHTDRDPGETTWSLTNESDDDIVIATGPDDDDSYDSEALYIFTWILNRCDSYIFQIFDSYGDGLYSPGYAALIVDGGRGNETLATIEGDFGNETSIDIYICDPSIPLTSSPSQSMQPSQSPSISHRPTSVSIMPTTVNIVMYLELHTDKDPVETTWSLTSESDDGIVIATGPDDEESYDSEALYIFTWILNRCDSYIFQIFDSYGDGLYSPGYVALIVDGGRGNETLATIEGDFGNEGSIDIYICDPSIPLTSSPSQSMQPSQSPSKR